MGYKKGEGGRPKGTPNKVTATVKEMFIGAAEGMGGMNRLVAWAKEDPANERVFWGLVARLIPIDVAAKVDEDLTIHITREVITKAAT